jgi:hypothetical protein
MKKVLLSLLLLITTLTIFACTDNSKIVKIEISSLPDKIVYIAGADTTLDLEGLFITLTDKAGKTTRLGIDAQKEGEPVFTVSESVDFESIATYSIKVTYAEGITAQFDIQVVEPPYVDDNPITVRLYNDSTRVLLSTTTGPFVKNVDIGVFSVFFTDVSKADSGYFQNVFTKYWNNYTNIDQYKIGYYLMFKLKNGETMEKLILGPKDDPDYMWDYVRVYLYDDVHQPIGNWYRHLLESEVTDTTLMTSIKLTGNTKTTDIDGAISLTVFTYNGEEDFDPITQLYRGISSYTITIDPK